ncbi:hypothetical protein HPP92_011200 [Vanilla planifolia]|uniref:Uncharacterized protein n=1 Tax=Vanilla planifolia TaxID=51239 RepID=A0A835V4T1_VANPL|nr:hypothetical protein HPP92_011200 [Vanilla planifolia]
MGKANLVIHPEEPKSSLQLSNENPPILIETDAEQTNEIVEVEGTERASQVRPSKRRCFSSFTDTSDKFMNQLACLSSVCGPYVTAAAVDAATSALCHQNPCAITALEAYGDKIAKSISSPFKNEFKSETKVGYGMPREINDRYHIYDIFICQ